MYMLPQHSDNSARSRSASTTKPSSGCSECAVELGGVSPGGAPVGGGALGSAQRAASSAQR